MWKAKVARYLAYCIDGGLMHSKVTIQKLFQYSVKDLKDEEKDAIHQELQFLLHVRYCSDKDGYKYT